MRTNDTGSSLNVGPDAQGNYFEVAPGEDYELPDPPRTVSDDEAEAQAEEEPAEAPSDDEAEAQAEEEPAEAPSDDEAEAQAEEEPAEAPSEELGSTEEASKPKTRGRTSPPEETATPAETEGA